MPGEGPIEQIKIGPVCASVWRNDRDSGARYTTQFQKSYYDDDGNLKYTGSFSERDLLALRDCVDLAIDKVRELTEKDKAGQHAIPAT
jgi:hypothetical protein